MNTRLSVWAAGAAVIVSTGMAGMLAGTERPARADARATPAGVNQPGAPVAPAIPGASVDGMWTFLDAMPAEVLAAPKLDRPAIARAVRLDHAVIRERLRTAPLERTARARTEPVVLELPMPDGGFAQFSAVESPIMEPGLAAKFPDIKTYVLRSADQPLGGGRLMMSDAGFHASLRVGLDRVYITRCSVGDSTHHWTYWTSDYSKEPFSFQCHTADGPQTVQSGPATRPIAGPGSFARFGDRTDASSRSGRSLSVFTTAVSTTGEYTQEFGGGTAAGIMPVVVSVLLNVNEIYENELATRLVLIANNDLLLQTDPLFDAFPNPNNAGVANQSLQTLVDTTIGEANYDIAHVLHYTAGEGQANGLAGGIGTVCILGVKGQCFSSTDDLQGPISPFTTNIVCHEYGHCFAGRHNFNNCGGTGPRENPSVCPEPGSGSTVMSYAGICGFTNLQQNADPMFSQLNFDQMYAYISTGPGGGCDEIFDMANTPPTVNGGPDRMIPSKTPFTLTAVGADADNDTLTYSWETREVGPSLVIPLNPAQDNGESPIARVWPPTTNPSRTFPRIEALLSPTFQNPAEILPQVARTMMWRVTARDNHPGSGGVATDDVDLTIVSFAGPFRVLTPSEGQTVRGLTTVTWDPASTHIPPVGAQNVRILLSVDNGLSFPINLLDSTPNTGSAIVTMPSLTSIQARLKIEATDNVFFAVSPSAFTVNPPIPGVSFSRLGAPVIEDVLGNGNSNGFADPGETVNLSVPVVNIGSTAATSVTGTLVSLTPTATVVGNFGVWPALPYGQPTLNTIPFAIALAPNHPCGEAINLRLTMNSAQGTGSGSPINFSITAGSIPGAGEETSFRYVGAVLPIPDNDPAGVNVPIEVTGFGIVNDLNVRLGDLACGGGLTEPTAGIQHSFVGDLIITLRSPMGTTVTLLNRPGQTVPSSGNNFCRTLLDDDFAGPTIQTIQPSGAPYSTILRPFQALSAFDSQNANGTWIMNVSDRRALDTGVIRDVSLVMRPNNPSQCAAPAQTGACCAAGVCTVTNQVHCSSPSVNGAYQGDASACSPSLCPQPTGACCLGATCSVVTSDSCAGGTFIGSGSTCNAAGNAVTPCCKADFNRVGDVTVQDVFDFLNAWFSGSGTADFNGSGITVQDVFDFLQAWFNGCP